MAVTSNTYTVGGSGQAGPYSYGFPIIAATDIAVSVDGVVKTVTTHYTVDTANTRITFVSGQEPATGTKVIVYRDTDEDPINATFVSGSTIRSKELNDNFKQLLYIAQESDNQSLSKLGGEMEGDLGLGLKNNIYFEGATDNAYETTLTVADPTADRTITLPNVTGTVVTTGDTGTVTSAMITDGTIVNADVNASAAIAQSKLNIANATTSAAGYQSAADKTKLDGIETAATADQTNAEIRAAVEAATDSNVFTDADHSKLNAIEANATADQTNAEIRAAVEAATDSNVFTDADHGKLNAIETGATGDQTASEIKVLIASSPLDASHLAANSVNTSEIANDAVDGDKIADNVINSEHYAADSIDSEHYAPGSVDTTAIATNAVTANELADNAVDTNAIASTAVNATKLASNAVTSSKITDANVTTLKIADSNVTLGKLHGDLKQATIADSDTQIPTSGAVVDYVAAQLAPIGGLEVIATDAAFPNTQPAAGVVISIADAGGLVVASGTSTTGRTVGNSTVTINNIASNFNGTTVDPGVAFMVSSTGSGQVYNYHKATLKEADLLSLSGDINDFAERYRVSADPDNLPNKDEGDLVYDTNANKMKVYDNSTSAWKEVTSTGDFKYLFLCPAGGTGAPTINGSIATYDLREGSNSGSAASVTVAAQLMVSINGVVQKANTGTSAPSEGFALVDGNTIVFGANLASGSSVFIVQFGAALTINTPGDGTVTATKIGSGAVETAKIADDAVNADKLASNAVVTASIADDAVNADKLANSINTEIAANTAKVTNATHTGEVTGATALTIADNVVDEANLKADNSPTNDYVLTAKSSAAGGLTWAAASGGIPDAGNTVTGAFALDRSTTIKLDAGQYLWLTADQYVDIDAGQYIDIDATQFIDIHTAQTCKINATQGVALWHNGSKKAETVSGGLTVTGVCTATSFSGSGANLTNLPGSTSAINLANASGECDITASGNVDINAGNDVTIDSTASWYTTAGTWARISASQHIKLDAGNAVDIDAAHAVTINSLHSTVIEAAHAMTLECAHTMTIDSNNGALTIKGGNYNTYDGGNSWNYGLTYSKLGTIDIKDNAGTDRMVYMTSLDSGQFASVSIGHKAGNDQAGARNVCVGVDSGEALVAGGDDNVLLGYQAGNDITTGDYNTVVGNYAAGKITDNIRVTAVGGNACSQNTSSKISAFGYNACQSNTSGLQNTGIGYAALQENTTNANSTAVGYEALINSTGGSNTGVGAYAGDSITTGSNLTCIGYNAEPSANNATNEMSFGNSSVSKYLFNTKPGFIGRGWVNFDGNTFGTNGSGNVDSMTDNGTGDYTVTWDVDMPNDDYCIFGTAREDNAGISTRGEMVVNPMRSVDAVLAGSVRFSSCNSANGTQTNCEEIFLGVMN